jgi:hypothetical protein
MRRACGLPLSNATLEAWSRVFCFDLEPLYLTPEWGEKLEGRVLNMTRAEFGGWLRSMPLEYGDAYRPWRVGSAESVTLLTPAQFSRLEPDLQRALNAAQVQLNRGLTFPLEEARGFGIAPEFLERDGVDASLNLRRDAWDALPRDARFAWLESYISEDTTNCLSSSLTMHARKRHRHALTLVGWLPTSGANCFATALAQVTRDRSVAGLWLQAPTLQRALEARGYKEKTFTGTLEADAVLVWRGADGTWAHACAGLGEGLVLNKDAQAWYAPRQIIALDTVLERWREDGLEVVAFTPATTLVTTS